MLIVERQTRLLDILRRRKAVQLDELAGQLCVSVSTIRRDLEVLAGKGQVRRTHGGAMYVQSPETSHGRSDDALGSRMDEHVAGKQRIGRYVASLVQPQMTLLLDGGSTVIYAARQISARPIQIVTSSLAIAHLFAEDDLVELTLLGGHLYPRTAVVVGPITRQCLKGLYADLCLFSLAGIDEQAGYNLNAEMARTEQLMIQQADRSILLMDSSKFGRKSLVRVCDVAALYRIITDDGIEPAWRDKLDGQLIVADERTP